MKLIHFLGNGLGHTKSVIDHYADLNNNYQVRLYNNDYNLLPQYVNIFENVQSKFTRSSFTLYFQQELLKLTILKNCGGWWCDTISLTDKPFDYLIDTHQLKGSFSYIQYGCSDRYILFIPKDWTGWNFCDNLLEHLCNQVRPPHPYLIRTLVYKLAPLHPTLFKVIQSDKVVRLDMPHGEDTMVDKEKNSKKAIAIMKRFLAARDRWVAAGKPLRTEEEKKKIFDICKQCAYIQKDIFGFKCSICQCRLHNSRDSVNKIAMATEQCPLEKPKWEAKI